MATGEVLLLAGAWWAPDATASNASAEALYLVGTQSNPYVRMRVWAFDTTTQEHVQTAFRMPADYASGGTMKILWMTNDIGSGEDCTWAVRVGAITPADTDTPLEHAFAAAASTNTSVNTTEARRLIETSITLTMDSAAAGDLVQMILYRDVATDDLTSDAEFIAASFSYTTT